MRAATTRRSGGAGFTLIEVLVAVSLMGLAVVGTLRAMDAGISGSARHREHATALAWLQTTSDVLVNPLVTPIEPCTLGIAGVAEAYRLALSAQDLPVPDGWALPSIGVQFWDGTRFQPTNAGCRSPDPQLQLITLAVTSPSGQVTRSLEVVKSDV
jgi:prepilin-type N-terminal cleavage/methylation domain-containing protein